MFGSKCKLTVGVALVVVYLLCVYIGQGSADEGFKSRQSAVGGIADIVNVGATWLNGMLFNRLETKRLNERAEQIRRELDANPESGVLVEIDIYESRGAHLLQSVYVIGTGSRALDPLKRMVRQGYVRGRPSGDNWRDSPRSRFVWYRLDARTGRVIVDSTYSSQKLYKQAYEENAKEDEIMKEFRGAGQPDQSFIVNELQEQQEIAAKGRVTSAPLSGILRQVLQQPAIWDGNLLFGVPEQTVPDAVKAPESDERRCNILCIDGTILEPVFCDCIPVERVPVFHH